MKLIVLLLIDTVASMAVSNIEEKHIVVFHLSIIEMKLRSSPDDPREIKTGLPIRIMHLTGMVLASMQQRPVSFYRYSAKKINRSNALNK